MNCSNTIKLIVILFMQNTKNNIKQKSPLWGFLFYNLFEILSKMCSDEKKLAHKAQRSIY